MNQDKPLYPRRKNPRISHCDYATGYYFVTVCTHEKMPWFGELAGQKVVLTPLGEAVVEEWRKGATLHQGLTLDEYVVMPNHVHMILGLAEGGNLELGRLIGLFKAGVTRRARQMGLERFSWQRNYHEHAIRGERDLARIREYVVQNPLRWDDDEENPRRTGAPEPDRP